MSAKKNTLENFLREKLESEVGAFGDGNTEFHTRDLQQLLSILDDKDEEIRQLKEQVAINSNEPQGFKEILLKIPYEEQFSYDEPHNRYFHWDNVIEAMKQACQSKENEIVDATEYFKWRSNLRVFEYCNVINVGQKYKLELMSDAELLLKYKESLIK